MRKKKPPYIVLIVKERQRLNQLLRRKLISIKAKNQILALLALDKEGRIVEVAEKIGICYQTLSLWREKFADERMDSLLVFKEDKERKKRKEKGNNFFKKDP